MVRTLLLTLELGFVICLSGSIIRMRWQGYRRLLRYEPTLDYKTPNFGQTVETITVYCTSKEFHLPDAAARAVSAFLELTMVCNLRGWFDEPSLELESGNFKDTQYFERGAKGRRYINLSRLLAERMPCETPIMLRGRGISWSPGLTHLHLFYERPQEDDRVVIISPHPDDAEIAAFGFYSEVNAAIITITAGDNTDRFIPQTNENLALTRDTMAKLRVWDSLHVPALGGVSWERTVNLCYPDGQLAEMWALPEQEFSSRSGESVDYAVLRQMNPATWRDSPAAGFSWSSLIQELETSFRRLQPSIVVAPLPLIDSHPDHGATTLAVCEALRRCGFDSMRMFLYVVHNQLTSLYPFGPIGSGVSLPPDFAKAEINCQTVYSHTLSLQQQRWKLLALEAMHDLYEPSPMHAIGWRAKFRQLKAVLGSFFYGLGNPPTSFLRRAVRPDEIFFVMTVEKAEALALAHLKQL